MAVADRDSLRYAILVKNPIAVPRELESIPGPPAHELLYQTLVKKVPLPVLMEGWLARFGGVYRVWLGEWLVALATRESVTRFYAERRTIDKSKGPKTAHRFYREFLGDNLAHAKTESWTVQRKQMQGAFRPDSLERYIGDFVGCTTAALDAVAALPVVPDVTALTARFAFDVVGKTLFNVDFGSFSQTPTRFRRLHEALLGDLAAPVRKLVPAWDYLPIESNRRVQRTLAAFDEVVYALIDERGAGDASPGACMLDQLLASGLPRKTIRDNVCFFPIAGQDTTSTSISMTLYNLGVRPDVQERVREEVLGVFADGPLHLAGLKELGYLSCVVKETMRLNPALPYVPSRCTTEDVSLGDIFIPGGTTVSVFIHSLHRNPTIWEEPGEFRPERFEGKVPSYSWLPFGAGPHHCIGANFSLIEQYAFLAETVRRFHIEKTPKTKLTMRQGLVPFAPVGLELRFVPR